MSNGMTDDQFKLVESWLQAMTACLLDIREAVRKLAECVETRGGPYDDESAVKVLTR